MSSLDGPVALQLQNPAMGSEFFSHAISNGANQWITLDCTGLTVPAAQEPALQSSFAYINTDNVYSRLAGLMGGTAEVQKCFRDDHVPGFGDVGRLIAAPGMPIP